MKTRTGFVSNSSSSSFIAYGAVTDMNGVVDLVETLAPGKMYELFADKLHKGLVKYDATHKPYTADDERFAKEMCESLRECWPIEFYDIERAIEFPLPVENLYEDDQVVIGYMVDTEEMYGVEKVFGRTFSEKQVNKVKEVLEQHDIEADLIIGRRQC